MAAQYGPKAQRKIKKVMREFGHGQLKSDKSGKKVTSRKQAVAIGISEARSAGTKVPKKSVAKEAKKVAPKKTTTKKTSTKSSGTKSKTKKTATKKSSHVKKPKKKTASKKSMSSKK